MNIEFVAYKILEVEYVPLCLYFFSENLETSLNFVSWPVTYLTDLDVYIIF